MALGDEYIKDELLESIKLGNVKVILSEFIPCDRNTLESIGQKLMSKRTLHGEFVTMLMDNFPESTTFVSEPWCNSIRVVDSLASEYIACEASMQDPDDVVEQEEVVGMFLSHEGHVIYGAQINRIYDIVEDGSPQFSIDHLARIIIDLMNDSSLLMDTLITHQQRRLMDCIFKGTPNTRYKFVGVLAEVINPLFEDVNDYADGEEYQNEMEQIIDNLQIVHKNNRDGTITFVGEAGILIVSKNWKSYELLVSFYSLLRSAEIFVDGLFHRMELLWDELSRARNLIDKTAEGDYTVITRAQNILTEATANYTILNSTGGYLHRGFGMIHERWTQAKDSASGELMDAIGLDKSFDTLVQRIEDVELVLKSLESEVEGLQTLLSTQIEQQMRRVYNALRDNTRSTSEVIRASERTGDALNVIELILSGSIAFDIVLAITGEYVTPIAALAEDPQFQYLYFILALSMWLTLVLLLKKGMDWVRSRVEKAHLIRLSLNAKCNPEALERFIASKEITSMDEEYFEDREAVRVLYNTTTSNGEPHAVVTLTYDRKNRLLQEVSIETRSHDVSGIRKQIMEELNVFIVDEDDLEV